MSGFSLAFDFQMSQPKPSHVAIARAEPPAIFKNVLRVIDIAITAFAVLAYLSIGFPALIQSAIFMSTAVTLVKPRSLSDLAASTDLPPSLQ